MVRSAQSRPHGSAVRTAVLPLFLVSGATGLIYEVAWTRSFGTVFGNTVFAISTVLTAFMLGLALGSWLLGRLADRAAHPLQLYAFLELGIGAYAFLFTTLLSATDVLYGWFFRSLNPGFYSLSLVRCVLSVLLLLLPTALMGGTLPVISKLWENASPKGPSEGGIGQSVGLLYAVNTFGAVAGTFLCGYFLLRLLGVSSTIRVAASANILIGAAALVLSRFAGSRQEGISLAISKGKGSHEPWKGKERSGHEPRRRREARAAAESAGKRRLVLAAVGLAGFGSLALEVLWSRVLVFVLGTSAYAFACMLTTFLLGVALGSCVCSRLLLARIRNSVFALGAVELLIGLSALASIVLLGKLWHLDYLVMGKLGARGFWREVLGHFIDSSIILLIPTMLMGAAFPIAVKACAPSWRDAGSRIGEVYASNTLGCVLGSFTAGFVMIPLLGLRSGFLLVIAVVLGTAVFLVSFSEKSRAALRIPAGGISLAAILVGVLSVPQDVFLRTMNTYHYPSKIVYIKDDATGTVTVHDLPDGDRLIAVDGVNVAGVDLMLRTTQKLQGYVPLLAHSNPQKVLQIGFGSGETSGVGLGCGVDEYSIVEICPGVFEAGRYFEKINRGSYRNPRLRKIIMDGKNFVKLTDETFDIIMNDATYPGTTGSSALYSYDHFKACRDRLRPGGVLSCWLPLDLRPQDFQMIVTSFQAAMPHASLWMANNCLNKHAVLMGTLSPLEIDFARVKRTVDRPNVAEDLEIINIHSVYDFLDCFVVDEEGLRKIGGDAPWHTDDKPLLEYGAAINRDVDACWTTVFGWIREEHAPVSRHVVNMGTTEEESQQVKATLDRCYQGTGHGLRALLAMLHGDHEITRYEFEMARKVNPDDRDVESCLEELRMEIAALVEAVGRMPKSASLRWRLAQKYLLSQEYERAAEEYRSFLEIVPDNAGGWNNLGVCCAEMKQLDEAARAFERAISLDPKSPSSYLGLADVQGKRGNFAEASRNYERTLSLNPRSQRTYLAMADTYYALERVEESIRALDRCLSIWPNFVPAYDKLGRAYFKQKKFDEALKAVEKAVELAPNDPRLRNLREMVREAAQNEGE